MVNCLFLVSVLAGGVGVTAAVAGCQVEGVNTVAVFMEGGTTITTVDTEDWVTTIRTIVHVTGCPTTAPSYADISVLAPTVTNSASLLISIPTATPNSNSNAAQPNTLHPTYLPAESHSFSKTTKSISSNLKSEILHVSSEPSLTSTSLLKTTPITSTPFTLLPTSTFNSSNSTNSTSDVWSSRTFRVTI
ncbi:hypothetical protein L873DRAFT_1810073 [Choiromyces venosus 120613-1]|uniref:Uncharacterized protein n=1 Tax=Choiromyces venosus 120613-1 TaxID=1336337 RepID=A0A3N4JJU6_9PEZI|nr:hypothetical protein L873DRAFT_1810073 [Choiromyces venosus 120613-1]